MLAADRGDTQKSSLIEGRSLSPANLRSRVESEPVQSVILVVCGAPLAARAPDLVAALVACGWRTRVIGTRASAQWLDVDAVTTVAGERPQFDFRRPAEPKRSGRPAAVVVCPATFHTVNKAVAGISDSYAMGVICEAFGAGVPTVVVPMVNDKLWGHPVWSRSLQALNDAGVTLLDVQTGERGAGPVASGTGDEVVGAFNPLWLVAGVNAAIGAVSR